MKGKLVLVSFSLLLLVLFPPVKLEAETINSITISPQVQVKQIQVSLGEIAQITGSDSFVKQAQTIALGRSPLPDYRRVLYRQMVVDALRQKNLNLANVRLNIPYQFVVTSNYRNLSVDNLVEMGKNHIYSQLPYAEENLKITPVSPPRQIKCPYGSVNFKVASSNRDLLGSAMLPIKILVDGQVYKQIYLQYNVKLFKKVLVAKKSLSRGKFVTKDLFTIEKRTVTHHRGEFVAPNADLEGKKLTQSLQPGDALLERMLEVPPLVKRWQDVTLIARVNGVEVTTTGRALEPGHKGEVIRVQNRNTGQTVKAKVIASGKVQIIIN